MVGLIILGVIIAIIVAIMLVPVGADVAYEGGELRLSAKVCGMLLQLIPKPPADETKPDVAQYNWGYDPLNYNEIGRAHV